MSLRARLTLAFTAVSLVPLAIFAALAYSAVTVRVSEREEREIEFLRAIVSSDVARAGSDLRTRAADLADQLSRSSTGRGGRDLIAAAADSHGGALADLHSLLAASAQDELLKVIRNDDGLVLAAFPFASESLSTEFLDPDSVRRAKEGTQLAAVYEGHQVESGDVAFVPSLQVAVPVSERVTLVVGMFLDQGYVDRISKLVDGTAVLVGVGEDAPVVAEDVPWIESLPAHVRGSARVAIKSDRERTVSGIVSAPITSGNTELAEGSAELWVVIGTSDGGLSEARTFITRTFVMLGLAFGLLSFAAGSLISRRLSAPVEDLVVGAAAIASGDLEHRVPQTEGTGEIGRLVDAFNQMAGDLSESQHQLARSERIAAWREIARTIAHEIKNPLTPIQLAVQTVRRAHDEKRDEFDEILDESTRAILEEVERLRELVREFSEFARMPAPHVVPTDLNEVVRSSLGLFTGLPDQVKLETMFTAGLPSVEIDRDQVSRAVLNLVGNAADALQGSGEIRVSTGQRELDDVAYIALIIGDDGPGMDEDTREKVFTPYFTTKSNGTGLGLAIVHRIVTDHGGRIVVESEPGKGSEFTLLFRQVRSGSGDDAARLDTSNA